MKVTPLDIRRREFKRAMRGYSDEEVDIFLDEVADEFERLFQENIELRDRLQRLDEQVAGHAQLREALEKTLISAQMQSDEMRANARKESELVMRDAEFKAREIVNESYSETQRVQQTLVQLKHLEEDFRFKFRSLLEGHLKLLSEAAIAPSGNEAAVVGGVGGAEAEDGTGLGLEMDALATDDIPTEETEAAAVARTGQEEAAAASAVAAATGFPSIESPSGPSPEDASIDTTANGPAEGTRGDGPPVRGFFFGRQLDDSDDAFLSPEDKKEKSRDFEW